MGHPWNNIWYKFDGLGSAISKLVAENPATLTYAILNQRNPFTYADMALNRLPTIEWVRNGSEAQRKVCMPLIYTKTVMRRIVYKTDENGVTKRYTELRMRGGDNDRRNACLGVSKEYLYESFPIQAICDWDFVFTPPTVAWDFSFTLMLVVVDTDGGLKYYYADSYYPVYGTSIPPAPDGKYGYYNEHLNGYITVDSESNVKCFKPIVFSYVPSTQTFDDSVYNDVIVLVEDSVEYNLAPSTGYYGSKVSGMMAYDIPFVSSIYANRLISDILYNVYPTTASSWTAQNIVRASVSGENAIKEVYNVNQSHADETLRTYQQALLANHTPWAGTYVDRNDGEFVLWQGSAGFFSADDGQLVFTTHAPVRLEDSTYLDTRELVININNDMPLSAVFRQMKDSGIPSVNLNKVSAHYSHQWMLKNLITGYMNKYAYKNYGLTFNLEVKGAWAIMTPAERSQAIWSAGGVWFFASDIGGSVPFIDANGNRYMFYKGAQYGELYQYNLGSTPYEIFGDTRTKVTLNIDIDSVDAVPMAVGGRSYGGRLGDDWATTLINTEADAVYDLACI